MTISPTAYRLALLGCVLVALDAGAQVTRTTPRPALAAAAKGASNSIALADTASLFERQPCVHDISSMLSCGGGHAPPPGGSITAVTVTVRTDRGTYTYTYNAPIDAVFLTYGALDRFAMPYYIHKLGFDAASAMRTRVKKGQRP